jgi:hypothetical protein
MPHQIGAGPDHRGDGGEAQSSVLGWLATATDSRPHNTGLQLVRALGDITSEYDVPLMVSRGMPSLTFLYGSAVEIRRAAEQGKPTYIYQFGDWDPSGVLIPQSIERRLNQMCSRLDCSPPIIERVDLTKQHIAEFNLPTRRTKRDRNRHANKFEGESVELDALPPRNLRDMVRGVIERHISPQALATLREVEDSEREQLRMFRGRE